MKAIDMLAHGWDVFDVDGTGRMEIQRVDDPVDKQKRDVDRVFKTDAEAIAHVVMLADRGNPACREALKKVVQSWNLDGAKKDSDPTDLSAAEARVVQHLSEGGPPVTVKNSKIHGTVTGRFPPRYNTPPNHWAVLPEYPVEDWKYEVANDDTRLGYHAWVENQREMKSLDDEEDSK
jgi:hypothetical protein